MQVNFTGLAIYARIAPHKPGYAGKSMACKCVTSSCYAHFQTRHTHSTLHFATAIAPALTIVSFKFDLLYLAPRLQLRAARPCPQMSSAPERCCCGCGFTPEEGREVHKCETTTMRLFAGFCQSSEGNGPCRRCAGGKAYKVTEYMLCDPENVMILILSRNVHYVKTSFGLKTSSSFLTCPPLACANTAQSMLSRSQRKIIWMIDDCAVCVWRMLMG